MNVLLNPGAEDSAGAGNFSSVLAPVGWVTTSNFTAVQYTIGGANDLNAADSAAIGGGINYFAGGPSTASSTATQSVDFTDLAASVDAGLLNFLLSAYIGGFVGQGDALTVTATFLSAGNVPVLTTSVGPVTPTDRANLSSLLLRSSGLLGIPAGARTVNVTMSAARVDGFYNDGYADNLSLVFSTTPQVPEPGTAVLFGLAVVGAVAVRRSHRVKRS